MISDQQRLQSLSDALRRSLNPIVNKKNPDQKDGLEESAADRKQKAEQKARSVARHILRQRG